MTARKAVSPPSEVRSRIQPIPARKPTSDTPPGQQQSPTPTGANRTGSQPATPSMTAGVPPNSRTGVCEPPTHVGRTKQLIVCCGPTPKASTNPIAPCGCAPARSMMTVAVRCNSGVRQTAPSSARPAKRQERLLVAVQRLWQRPSMTVT